MGNQELRTALFAVFVLSGGPRNTAGTKDDKCLPPEVCSPLTIRKLSCQRESLCAWIDVSKYLDIHEHMGKKLTELSLQDGGADEEKGAGPVQ
ncbi:mitochondrial import inner membrane translocase subunit Tim10-like [Microcaecilia unicolor]|uniref:Mitochondrial import inner membrane translocase subunit Tim10-like n=1 Tax=Microcaecilia unicolor TaxID=1415580 RepID=A0A6P7WYI0_9AMPH|nr:mitochondrial import inner membrane translocase subunit Tim10-like [Microcaecilia unicolor]